MQNLRLAHVSRAQEDGKEISQFVPAAHMMPCPSPNCFYSWWAAVDTSLARDRTVQGVVCCEHLDDDKMTNRRISLCMSGSVRIGVVCSVCCVFKERTRRNRKEKTKQFELRLNTATGPFRHSASSQ
jgi:hypothetical protein